MRYSTSGVLSTAGDLSNVVYDSFHLRVTARDHGDRPHSAHVDVIIVVDASIPYTNRHRGQQDPGEDGDDGFIDANLPFLLAVLGLCAAFVIIVIVLIAVAAAACGSRRGTRNGRQVQYMMLFCRILGKFRVAAVKYCTFLLIEQGHIGVVPAAALLFGKRKIMIHLTSRSAPSY